MSDDYSGYWVLTLIIVIRLVIFITTRVVVGGDGTDTYKPKCADNVPDIMIADLIMSIIVIFLSCSMVAADSGNSCMGVIIMIYFVVQIVFLGISANILANKRDDDCYVRSAIAEIVAIMSPFLAIIVFAIICLIINVCRELKEKIRSKLIVKKERTIFPVIMFDDSFQKSFEIEIETPQQPKTEGGQDNV